MEQMVGFRCKILKVIESSKLIPGRIEASGVFRESGAFSVLSVALPPSPFEHNGTYQEY